MTNAFAAPAPGQQIAWRRNPTEAIGRITAIRDIRGDGELLELTLDTKQPATGQPMTALSTHILIIGE